MADETQNVAGGETRQVKLAPSQQAIEELYVDGVVGMFARAGVIKINLYRVMGTDANDDAEVRSVTHRLVMPATAIPEMIRLFQNMAKAASEQQAQQQATTATGVDPESLI